MYENRFLCGVEGVNVEGRDGGGTLGGVWDLVGSCTRVEWLEAPWLPSGDNVGGVA